MTNRSWINLICLQLSLVEASAGLWDTAAQLDNNAPFLKITLSRNESESENGSNNVWVATDGAGVAHSLSSTEWQASNGVVRTVNSN